MRLIVLKEGSVRYRFVMSVVVAGVVLGACGGGSEPRGAGGGSEAESGAHGSMDHGGSGDPGAIDFGRPGDPDEASRTIRIRAFDSLEFRPSRINVKRGDTITFVVTNVGNNVHEFTLGDEDFQMAHEKEMSEGGMAHGAAYSLNLPPGATRELTWSFIRQSEVLYGCHEPGHYRGGMVGLMLVG
jgi:uncharacterized cupredoxin-like copper-binding protein